MANRPVLEILTRLGFAARGLLYIVIGVLVMRAGRAEDHAGVIEYVADGAGRWLVFAMAAGFIGYGLWRLADAALGIECKGDEKEAMKRFAAGISSAVHLYLAKQALEVALGDSRLTENGAQHQARELLQLPGGQVMLGLVAALLLAAGAYQLVVASKCSFLAKLDERVRETWVKWLGRAGYAARGIVFLIAGYFAARAALAERSSQVGGIEQALEWLSSPTDTIVAAGLLLFGIYALIEARYRRIHAPTARQIGREVEDAVTPGRDSTPRSGL